MSKSKPKTKDQKPVPTPLQKSVGDVVTAREAFDQSVALLEKAQAQCQQAYSRLQAAESDRAAFVFATIEQVKAGLMM